MGEHACKTAGEEQRGSDSMSEDVHTVNRLKRTIQQYYVFVIYSPAHMIASHVPPTSVHR
jgi:hypothetical protein